MKALFLLAAYGATIGVANARNAANATQPQTFSVARTPGDWDVDALRWAPNGETLGVGVSRTIVKSASHWDERHFLQLWNVRPPKLQRAFEAPSPSAQRVTVSRFAWSPDGATIAIDFNRVGNGNGISLWRWRDGNSKTLAPSFGPMAWVSNDRLLSHTYSNLRFRMWDVVRAQPLQQIGIVLPRDRLPEMPRASSGASMITPNLVLSPDARQGAVTLWPLKYQKLSEDYLSISPTETLLFDPLTGQHHRLLVNERDTAFFPREFSGDGLTLASVDTWSEKGARVRLHCVPSGREMATISVQPSEDFRHGVLALSPQGGTLAVATTRHTIQLHDTASGAMIRELKSHSHNISSLAFSPNGRTLASGSSDGTVLLWRVN